MPRRLPPRSRSIFRCRRSRRGLPPSHRHRPVVEACESRTLLTLTINLFLGPELSAMPAAAAAFQAAANTWTSALTDDVTINIDAELSDTTVDDNQIGGAVPSYVEFAYSDLLPRLIADGSADEQEILGQLPAPGQLTFRMPAGFSVDEPHGAGNPYLHLTRANAKALGFGDLPGAPDSQYAADPNATIDASITLRKTPTFAATLLTSQGTGHITAVNGWDFDPSDGILADSLDFTATVTHEIGHALGFTSAVDDVDARLAAGSDNKIVNPDLLDLFRIEAGSWPDFATAPRILDTGQDVPDQVLYLWDQNLRPAPDGSFQTTIFGERAVSTGTVTGDGQQASHRQSGIMAPTLTLGTAPSMTGDDLRAFDLIGWDWSGYGYSSTGVATAAMPTQTATDTTPALWGTVTETNADVLVRVPELAETDTATLLVDGATFSDPSTFTYAYTLTNPAGSRSRITRAELLLPGTLDQDPTFYTLFDPSILVDFHAEPTQAAQVGLLGPESDTSNDGDVPDLSKSVVLTFDDFDPGETLSWSLLVDGSPTFTGDQLIGAHLYVTFANGLTAEAAMGPVAGDSDASTATVSMPHWERADTTGTGFWTLTGDPFGPLAVGSHDVEVMARDAGGTLTTTAFPGGLVIAPAANTDIQVQSATAQGTTLSVSYTIGAVAASAFSLGFFRSGDDGYDTSDAPTGLVAVTDPADLSVGPHTKQWTIGGGAGEAFLPGVYLTLPDTTSSYYTADMLEDYDLLVVADPFDAVAETDADPTGEDNTAALVGAYVTQSPPSVVTRNMAILAFGSSADDTISFSSSRGGSLPFYSYSASVTINGQQTSASNNSGAGIAQPIKIRIRGGAGDDVITAGSNGYSGASLWGGAGDDSLTGGAMAEDFFVGPGTDTLSGGGGNDLLRATIAGAATLTDSTFNGPDGSASLLSIDRASLTGGSGADNLDASGFSGSVTMIGAAGDDTLRGGAGNDSLDGGDGDDSLDGGDGDDRLTGGPGAATIQGGAGGDTIVEKVSGVVTLSAANLAAGAITATLSGIESAALTGGAGDDSLDAGAFGGPVTLIGNNGHDTLTGSGGADSLSGGAGNDSLLGGAGNDTLSGAKGNDTLDGGADTDLLTESGAVTLVLTDASLTGTLGVDALGSIDRASVLGTPEDDTLDAAGFSGPVTLNGGNGNALYSTGSDSLVGGSGNDSITGGDGDDTLTGGAGDDTLAGGNGTDLLRETTTGGSLTLTGTASSGSLTGDLGVNALSGIEQAHLTGGSPSGNTLDASGFTAGPVTLTGGNGDDALTGGGLDDVLEAGFGNDTIDGGGGTDTFVGAAQSFATLTNTSLNVLFGTFVTTLSSIEQAKILGTELDDTIDASGFTTGPVTLIGGPGNDSLKGGTGADVLSGGDGVDTLNGGSGPDTLLESFEGSALPVQLVVKPTVLKTTIGTDPTVIDSLVSIERADLTASDFDDVIDATAYHGATTLDGGPGRDTIIGGSGTDLIRGGPGALGDPSDPSLIADSLSGGDGDDTLDGQDGDDTLDGGDGDDWIILSIDGRAVLSAGSLASVNGTDALASFERASLTGGGGHDRLDASGFTGPVTLIGGAGNDSITGGTADDILTGGLGTDSITGGTGTDRLVEDAGSGFSYSLTLTNTALDTEPIAGIEQASLALAKSGVIDASAFSGPVTLIGGSSRDTIIGGIGDDCLMGGAGDDSIVGGDGNDWLDGAEGNDWLDGGAGDDFVRGGDNNDTLSGGGGIDTINGQGHTDLLRESVFGVVTLTGNGALSTLTGGQGTDAITSVEQASLTGGTGDDSINASTFGGMVTLLGGDGNDTLRGTYLADSLDGGAGNDSMLGAAGNDTFRAGAGDDTITGGNGTDRLIEDVTGTNVVTGSTGAATVTGSQGVDRLSLLETVVLFGGDGDDSLDGGGFSGSLSFDGGDGNDVLIGGAGRDTLFGGTGNDSITGGGGWDTINGGDGTDRLSETITGSAALLNTSLTMGTLDTLYSVEEAVLTGSNSSNRLDAGGFSGAVTLLGNGGNDALIGGTSSDVLIGGTGNDTITGGAGIDSIDGGSGNDRLAETISGAVILTATQFTDAQGTETFTGIDKASLAGGAGDDSIDASAFGGPITLAGNDGNDTLRGGTGTDSIDGGAGDDSITGGAGNDTITGGAGDDSIDGGAGVDRLVESADGSLVLTDTQLVGASGTDTLTDINHASLSGGAGDDSIDASGFTGRTTLSGLEGADLLVGGSAGNSLDGGSGNDTLDGGLGSDTLVGGLGSDQYRFGAVGTSSEVDSVLEGYSGGFDTLDFSWLDAADPLVVNLASDTALGTHHRRTVRTLNGGTAGYIEGAIGGAGNDHITGNAANNFLSGGDGDDTLDGGNGTDTLDGGNGTDQGLNGEVTSNIP